MAAELKRKDDDTILLAMHPGEVATYVHKFLCSFPYCLSFSPSILAIMISHIQSQNP